MRIHVAFAEIHNISSHNDDRSGFSVNSVDYDMINKGADESTNTDVGSKRIAKQKETNKDQTNEDAKTNTPMIYHVCSEQDYD